MIYFTSDTHYNHANILEYCKDTRPFETIEEHDEALIRNWNAKVGPEDVVWHLGDFAMGDRKVGVNALRQLNGQVNFIHGNHDQKILKMTEFTDQLNWHGPYKEIALKFDDGFKVPVTLCHFPLEIWNHRHHGAWCFHGHTHGSFPSPNWQRRVDVGVDVWNFAPVSQDEIRAHMKNKIDKPLDHHGKKNK